MRLSVSQTHMVSRAAIAGTVLRCCQKTIPAKQLHKLCQAFACWTGVHTRLCTPASVLFCGNPLQLAWVFAPAARPQLLCPLQEDDLQLYVQMAELGPWLKDCQDYYIVQGVHMYVLQPPSKIWHWCRPIFEAADSVTVAWPGDGVQPTLQPCCDSPIIELQSGWPMVLC